MEIKNIFFPFTKIYTFSLVGLRTGSRFLSKTSIWGSIDKPNRTFVYGTKYQTSIWEGLKRFLLPKIYCFRHKFRVILHQNSVACMLFHVGHLQSLFCHQQTGKSIFRGSGSRLGIPVMRYGRAARPCALHFRLAALKCPFGRPPNALSSVRVWPSMPLLCASFIQNVITLTGHLFIGKMWLIQTLSPVY